ncbi:MAG: SdrD B-like domain-containing protein, partial [Rhizobiaceae bacterium]
IMNPDGTITVAPGTTAGVYTYPYTICEILNPLNCATIDATVTIPPLDARLSGVVFEDENSNGVFDSGEPVEGGYIVQLVRGGVVIATTVTNPDGSYEFTGIPAGTGYSVATIDPATGEVVSGRGTIDIVAGSQIADVNLPIDPSGVVYDSVTRLPVAGATVTITDASGTPLPAVCLASPAQQAQTTGPDGSYRFDIMAGADPACPIGQTEYRLQVTAPAGYVAAPSTAIVPASGALDASICAVDGNAGGSCAVQPQAGAPAGAAATTYFLVFLIAAGDPNVVHNHIPLDPAVVVPGDVTVTKRASSQIGLRGGVMTYTITATNNGGAVTADLNIIDRMPVGFTLIDGSVTIDGAPATATVNGRTVTMPATAIPASGQVVVTLQLRIPVNAQPGEYVNDAYALDPATGVQIGTGGSATIRIRPEAVFDCGDIIGKVFDDRNGNGIQDGGTSPYEPERGIAGVRLVTVKGELITTDKNGQYHVPCAMLPDRKIGSNFILKLDTRTLPTGYHVTTENPRVIRLTAGKVSKLNFGAAIGRVVRLDLRGDAFAGDSAKLKPEWNEGIAQLIATLSEENSVLRLTYFAGQEDASLAKARLGNVRKQIEAAWKKSDGNYKLSIETEMVRRK